MGHRQIEEKNVGLDLRRQFDGLQAVAGFSDHFHVGFGLQQAPEAVAENRMIVGNHNANRLCASIHDWSSAPAECALPAGHRAQG